MGFAAFAACIRRRVARVKARLSAQPSTHVNIIPIQRPETLPSEGTPSLSSIVPSPPTTPTFSYLSESSPSNDHDFPLVTVSPIPIPNLPAELLQHIFGYLSIIQPVDFGPTEFKKRGFLLNGMAVCREWKRIIVSTHAFWSYIQYSKHPLLASRPGADFVDYILRRSHGRPLHVTMRSASFIYQNEAPLHLNFSPDPVLGALLASSNRWESLTIDDDLLTFIDLDGSSSLPRRHLSAFGHIFSGAHALTTVSINLYAHHFLESTFRDLLDWDRITTLEVHHGPFSRGESFEQLVTIAPNVEVLRLYGRPAFNEEYNWSSIRNEPPILGKDGEEADVFPRLRCLHLFDVDISRVLHRFPRCPSTLEALSLGTTPAASHPIFLFIAELHAFLSSSDTSSLRRLSLTNLIIPDETELTLELLSQPYMENVTCLRLHEFLPLSDSSSLIFDMELDCEETQPGFSNLSLLQFKLMTGGIWDVLPSLRQVDVQGFWDGRRYGDDWRDIVEHRELEIARVVLRNDWPI
ncbi:hypothetical protein DL96DRAFT_262999 [Flagelloscypha sp. PMI_526]|nr:hypothetical protein DL96DRAFT_262999 [Flagelloscypha sp. PMI_526]